MDASRITFVTTCRGRLEHLKRSLPLMVAQPGASCVVVDYDCPQGTGDWVEANFPQVRLVRSGPQARFEVARARNLGAARAETEWLCFIDADALLEPAFVETVAPTLAPGAFYIASLSGGSITGMCLCRADDFESIDGYDAVLQGWGMEDKDLYVRFELAGLLMRRFPVELVTSIEHDTAMRVEHYAIKQRKLSSTLNLVYCRAKWDVMRMKNTKLDEPDRRAMYKAVDQGIKDALAKGAPYRLRVPTSTQKSFSGAQLRGSLLYELDAIPTATLAGNPDDRDPRIA